MHVQNKVFVLIAAFAALALTGVSTTFHYGNDFIVTSNRDDGSIPEDYLRDDKLRVAKRYYRDYSMNLSEVVFSRVKRSDEATFHGHPKTRLLFFFFKPINTPFAMISMLILSKILYPKQERSAGMPISISIKPIRKWIKYNLL